MALPLICYNLAGTVQPSATSGQLAGQPTYVPADFFTELLFNRPAI
jgi:hypothetical protein